MIQRRLCERLEALERAILPLNETADRERLIRAVQAGDEAALEPLVRSFLRRASGARELHQIVATMPAEVEQALTAHLLDRQPGLALRVFQQTLADTSVQETVKEVTAAILNNALFDRSEIVRVTNPSHPDVAMLSVTAHQDSPSRQVFLSMHIEYLPKRNGPRLYMTWGSERLDRGSWASATMRPDDQLNRPILDIFPASLNRVLRRLAPPSRIASRVGRLLHIFLEDINRENNMPAQQLIERIEVLEARRPQAHDVATTILQQLGGQRRLAVMLNAKNFLYDKNSVQFRLPSRRGKPNHVKIALKRDDTYTVTFGSIRGLDFKKLKEFAGIQVSNLRDVIERNTGLYLSL